MEIAAARTFLAIVEAGNFVSASRRLNVTQSTVSARIKSLEAEIGKPLFIRTKSACAMTPAGAQFYRYARTMLRAWEEARLQIAVPEGFKSHLSVGGQYSLWNRFLLDWLAIFTTEAPTCSIRASVGMPQRLMRELVEGVLDLAVMFNPENRPGLVVTEIFDDTLVLVSAAPADEARAEDYVFVDWGEEFRVWHAAHQERLHNPGLVLDLGSVGIRYLVANKKTGYFPERIARAYLKSGALRRLDGPTFSYPAYCVRQADYGWPDVIDRAISVLRTVAARKG